MWKFRKDSDGYETTEESIESISTFSDCVKYVWEIKWRKGRDTLQRKYSQYIEEEFPWFRGVRDIKYDLIPGLYWLFSSKDEDQIKNIAEDIREEFRRRGEYYFRESHRVLEEGEWFQLMQHYGVPTRLLDWTEGALIALYFAIRMLAFGKDKTTKAVPCVWMLNPSWLNHESIKTSLPVYITEAAMNKYPKTDGQARKYLDEKDLPDNPIAMYPIHIDLKIHAQKSVFTIHGRIQNAFHELCLSNPEAEICRLVINPGKIADIAEELRLMGITESTIFPELKGLANEIRNEKGIHFSFDR
ncbi:MAG: FRG domain-containing protein [Syntrophorhabdales bacterium]|jgi:hypothetical protein